MLCAVCTCVSRVFALGPIFALMGTRITRVASTCNFCRCCCDVPIIQSSLSTKKPRTRGWNLYANLSAFGEIRRRCGLDEQIALISDYKIATRTRVLCVVSPSHHHYVARFNVRHGSRVRIPNDTNLCRMQTYRIHNLYLLNRKAPDQSSRFGCGGNGTVRTTSNDHN